MWDRTLNFPFSFEDLHRLEIISDFLPMNRTSIRWYRITNTILVVIKSRLQSIVLSKGQKKEWININKRSYYEFFLGPTQPYSNLFVIILVIRVQVKLFVGNHSRTTTTSFWFWRIRNFDHSLPLWSLLDSNVLDVHENVFLILDGIPFQCVSVPPHHRRVQQSPMT